MEEREKLVCVQVHSLRGFGVYMLPSLSLSLSNNPSLSFTEKCFDFDPIDHKRILFCVRLASIFVSGFSSSSSEFFTFLISR